MFTWLRGQPVHLYTGYVTARRLRADRTVDVAVAPYAVFSQDKASALIQGTTFIRARCPTEQGWVDHRAEFIRIPDFMLQKPRIRALSVVAQGVSFDGTLEIDEMAP